MTCPACAASTSHPAEPGPRRPTLAQWWVTGSVTAVAVMCCGYQALTSVLMGGMSLVDFGVLGLFVGLIVVDLLVVRPMAVRTVWHCLRCGHGWSGPVGHRPAWQRALRGVTTVALPWNLAAFLLAPRHRLAPEDPVIAILSRVRVALGLAIVVGVALWYRSYDALDPETFLRSWALSAFLAVPSFLACLGLFVAVTRPARRRATVRQFRWPVLSLLGFGATVALLVLYGEGADDATVYLRAHAVRLPLDGTADVYLGAFGLWVLVFTLRAMYLVSRNWFNAVDGHLLLPPVIAILMSWLVVLISLIADLVGPPGPASLALIVGGAAATTILAVVEGWRAVRRYGVTLRDGPLPAGRPERISAIDEQVGSASSAPMFPRGGPVLPRAGRVCGAGGGSSASPTIDPRTGGAPE